MNGKTNHHVKVQLCIFSILIDVNKIILLKTTNILSNKNSNNVLPLYKSKDQLSGKSET